MYYARIWALLTWSKSGAPGCKKLPSVGDAKKQASDAAQIFLEEQIVLLRRNLRQNINAPIVVLMEAF